MKKPRKRYSKPYQVHAEILKLKRKAKESLEQAEAIERTVRGYLDQANLPETNAGTRQYLVETADFERKKAIKLRRSVEITEDARIPRLVRTLQTLETKPMDFIKDDPSVERSK